MRSNRKKPLQINTEDINKPNAFFVGTIVEINDKRIVIQRKTSLHFVILSYFGVAIAALICIGFGVGTFFDWRSDDINGWIFGFFIIFSCLFAAIAIVLYWRTSVRNKQYVILDREHQTITQPKNALSKKHVIYPFKKTNIFISVGNTRSFYIYTGLNIANNWVINFIGVKDITLFKTENIESTCEVKITEFWKYITDYMERHTLPAGSAFDIWRNENYNK